MLQKFREYLHNVKQQIVPDESGYTAEEKAAVRRRKLVSLFTFLAVVLVFGFVALFAGKPLIDFVTDRDSFSAWLSENVLFGRLAFLGIRTLQTVVTILPAEAVEIAAGYGFGAIEGMILCLIGSIIGSAIIFGFTKMFGVRMAEAFISRDKINSLGFIHSAKRRDLLFFIIFLIPGTPKDTLSYLVGLTPMRLSTFLVLSGIARIPSIITSTLGGHAIGEQQYLAAVLIFAATALLSIAGIWLYRRIARREREAQERQKHAVLRPRPAIVKTVAAAGTEAAQELGAGDTSKLHPPEEKTAVLTISAQQQ